MLRSPLTWQTGPTKHPKVPDPRYRVLGDIFQLGPHRVLCGDALEASSYQKLMKEEKADMAFADVPYNVSIAHHAAGRGKKAHREFLMASGELSPEQFSHFLATATKRMAAKFPARNLHYLYRLVSSGGNASGWPKSLWRIEEYLCLGKTKWRPGVTVIAASTS